MCVCETLHPQPATRRDSLPTYLLLPSLHTFSFPIILFFFFLTSPLPARAHRASLPALPLCCEFIIFFLSSWRISSSDSPFSTAATDYRNLYRAWCRPTVSHPSHPRPRPRLSEPDRNFPASPSSDSILAINSLDIPFFSVGLVRQTVLFNQSRLPYLSRVPTCPPVRVAAARVPPSQWP